MTITIDCDVAAAIRLLESEFEAGKLQGIAQSLSDLAPALWGRYPKIEVAPAILTSESTLQAVSTQ